MNLFLLPICIGYLPCRRAKKATSAENRLSSTYEVNALLESAKLELEDIVCRRGNAARVGVGFVIRDRSKQICDIFSITGCVALPLKRWACLDLWDQGQTKDKHIKTFSDSEPVGEFRVRGGEPISSRPFRGFIAISYQMSRRAFRDKRTKHVA
jgi:hypothetical protein